jgi:group I intron endonuclease
MIGYIYRTTNKINGKTYIGKKHKQIFVDSYYGSGIVISSAIKKYGKENFEVVLIATADSLEDLNLLERQFILNEQPKYNLAPGGDGGDIISNLENKNDIRSRATAGIKKWHASLTEEEKEEWICSIKKAREGQGNFREGYIPTDGHRKKSSVSNTEAWNNLTAEERSQRLQNHSKAMSKRQGQQTHNSQQIEINGIIYASLTKAAAALGLKRHILQNKIKKGQIKCTLIKKK